MITVYFKTKYGQNVRYWIQDKATDANTEVAAGSGRVLVNGEEHGPDETITLSCIETANGASICYQRESYPNPPGGGMTPWSSTLISAGSTFEPAETPQGAPPSSAPASAPAAASFPPSAPASSPPASTPASSPATSAPASAPATAAPADSAPAASAPATSAPAISSPAASGAESDLPPSPSPLPASPPPAPPPPPGGGPDPNKKFYDQGYKDGSLGGSGVCPAHADADGEAAYDRGYADGKKAYERRRRAQKLADDSVSGGSNTTDADTGLIAAHMAEKMPVKEMEALQKAGIKVKVTRGNVTNYLTDLKGVHPRDWPEGATWDTVPGTYWAPTKEIVIATEDGGGGKRKLPGSDLSSSEDVFEHESAHALNRTGASGLMSDQDDFKSAFEKDGDKGKFAQEYYHQRGADGKDSSAGRDEAFAESNAMYISDPERLKRECPHLYDYWHSKLADE